MQRYERLAVKSWKIFVVFVSKDKLILLDTGDELKQPRY